MDSNLDQAIVSALTDFPDFDDLDLPALYDVPSPTSSSDCSSVSSPMSLPATDDSSCSASSSPASSPLPDDNPTDSSGSRQARNKHRSRCRTPQCLKKEHASILRRNERERNRVKLVSDGFANLRKHVPTSPVNKKLSKVETLRTAIEYIKYLQRILNEGKRRERERRLLQQVGWLEVPGYQRSSAGLVDPMNSILMELPGIAPYPQLPQAAPRFTQNSVSLPPFQFQ